MEKKLKQPVISLSGTAGSVVDFDPEISRNAKIAGDKALAKKKELVIRLNESSEDPTNPGFNNPKTTNVTKKDDVVPDERTETPRVEPVVVKKDLDVIRAKNKTKLKEDQINSKYTGNLTVAQKKQRDTELKEAKREELLLETSDQEKRKNERIKRNKDLETKRFETDVELKRQDIEDRFPSGSLSLQDQRQKERLLSELDRKEKRGTEDLANKYSDLETSSLDSIEARLAGQKDKETLTAAEQTAEDKGVEEKAGILEIKKEYKRKYGQNISTEKAQNIWNKRQSFDTDKDKATASLLDEERISGEIAKGSELEAAYTKFGENMKKAMDWAEQYMPKSQLEKERDKIYKSLGYDQETIDSENTRASLLDAYGIMDDPEASNSDKTMAAKKLEKARVEKPEDFYVTKQVNAKRESGEDYDWQDILRWESEVKNYIKEQDDSFDEEAPLLKPEISNYFDNVVDTIVKAGELDAALDAISRGQSSYTPKSVDKDTMNKLKLLAGGNISLGSDNDFSLGGSAAEQAYMLSKLQDAKKASERKPTSVSSSVEKYSKKYRVPSNLINAMITQESGGQADVVSSAGAEGIMQLMPDTAKRFGVTDSFDEDQNIAGGVKYMDWLLERYDGSEELALAAYNSGEGNVDLAIKKANTNDWNVVKDNLVTTPANQKQTLGYVKNIMAMKDKQVQKEQPAPEVIKPDPKKEEKKGFLSKVKDFIFGEGDDEKFGKGNIDLTKRPIVKNEDGTISTVRSISFSEDGKEILIPTVSPDGKILSNDDAISLYQKTGEYLGKFDSIEASNKYAKELHSQQDKLYSGSEKGNGDEVKTALDSEESRLGRKLTREEARVIIDGFKN